MWYNQPMKKMNRTTDNLIRILLALLIGTLMCFCMCACGGASNTEETIEITTPSQEGAEPADNQIIIGDKDEDKDAATSEEGSSEEADISSDSQYAQIYKDCNAKMKEATAKYVDELKDEASSLSKSKLYDETQARIDELKKIYDDGKDKMVEAMLASTEDDVKAYKKNFSRLTESYTEYTREITSAYTDAF